MYSFQCLHFDKLSTRQLYRISALRQEVFVVEQNCPYLDADGKDE
ncbi:MAG: GNAT family N-acetyltransferase, partial [Saprospiraceae bacterium]|nr:GNAT family N-acetyltransferase [Saprospiraceae bacterium]